MSLILTILTDLWKVFTGVFLPTLVFVALGFLFVYLLARYVSKIKVPGQCALIGSFALLGGVLGVTTGMSRSPVIGSILPALLTAIAMLWGFFFTKDSLKELSKVIPYCIIVLMTTAFFGILFGSNIRGKEEDFKRRYEKRLLYYKHVELEVEKAKQLKGLNRTTKAERVIDPNSLIPANPTNPPKPISQSPSK